VGVMIRKAFLRRNFLMCRVWLSYIFAHPFCLLFKHIYLSLVVSLWFFGLPCQMTNNQSCSELVDPKLITNHGIGHPFTPTFSLLCTFTQDESGKVASSLTPLTVAPQGNCPVV